MREKYAGYGSNSSEEEERNPNKFIKKKDPLSWEGWAPITQKERIKVLNPPEHHISREGRVFHFITKKKVGRKRKIPRRTAPLTRTFFGKDYSWKIFVQKVTPITRGWGRQKKRFGVRSGKKRILSVCHALGRTVDRRSILRGGERNNFGRP